MSGSYQIDKVRLNDIVITNAKIENNTELTAIDKKIYGHKYTYGFKAGADIQAKKLRVAFTCEMVTEMKSNTEEQLDITANFEVTYIFTVDNLNELATIEDEVLTIKDDLLIAIFNIAYATSRGVIYTRCQGTIINNFILPIVSDHKLTELIDHNK